MMKTDYRKLIITSLVTILPMVYGIVIYQTIPAVVPVHWNTQGIPDETGSKTIIVFFLPLIFLGAHLFAMWMSQRINHMDDTNRLQSHRVMNMIWWMVPVFSVVMSFSIYQSVLDQQSSVYQYLLILGGLLFVIIGNHILNRKQLTENRKTTRVSVLWIIAGMMMVIFGYMHQSTTDFINLICLFLLIIIPIVYSGYAFHQERKKGSDDHLN